jgi:YebC/PmpR family DNA-binding regulatory protein
MAGHSKWANIKHRKAAQDKKKAGVFTKYVKEITIAAREGEDPNQNAKLKLAIERSKAVNLPKDNITRAIQKGAGKNKAELEEVIFEAYFSSNIAFLIKALTDNKNRTSQEIKNIFKKNDAKLAEQGSVLWQFDLIGEIIATPQMQDQKKIDQNWQEELEIKILKTSAKNYLFNKNKFYIYTEPSDLDKVKTELETTGFKILDYKLTYQAKNKVELAENQKEALKNLINKLEELEDIEAIYININF